MVLFGKVQIQERSLAGRAKVINGGVGGGNPRLVQLMLSYGRVGEQGFCTSWFSYFSARASDQVLRKLSLASPQHWQCLGEGILKMALKASSEKQVHKKQHYGATPSWDESLI